MKQVQIKREELEEKIKELVEGIEEPLYRALGEGAQEDYEKERVMKPQEGSLSVGRGVFFTNSLKYALGFLKRVLVVTSKKVLDPEEEAIDTRVKGYDKRAKERLEQELGAGNYNGYQVWAEIQKKDTLTYEGGSKENYVYTRRRPVRQREVLAEVVVV